MYAGNEVLPVDEWEKAAAQGNADMQLMLGTMYAYSYHARQYDAASKSEEWEDLETVSKIYLDKVLAYAWLNLAASSGKELVARRGSELRGLLERDMKPGPWTSFSFEDASRGFAGRMSPAELTEAQRLSSTWKKGQILAREGRSASASTAPSTIPGRLSKHGTGTLFLVNIAGQAITNHHVIAGCGELRIEGRDGLAKVVTEDVVNDLALVQIPGEAKASAAITVEPGKLRQGEDIVVFGFPLNSVLSSGGNLTPGVVSALTGLGNNTNQIQITAPIQPGSSGSPPPCQTSCRL